MSDTVPAAPASPFDPRPSSTSDQSVIAPAKDASAIDSPSSTTSDSTLVNDSSAAAEKAELSCGHRRIAYPLTSFESTPHNVSAFGFALGIVFAVGVVLASGMISHKTFVWGNQGVDQLAPQGLGAAILNPVVGMYLTFWATFHMLEFQVTSIFNPGKLSVDSYLINNGAAYPIAHAVGLIEHILETAYLPAKYRLFKSQGSLVIIGAAIVLAGQVLRSFAMISAASNFSHIVAYNKLKEHELVKTGIYAWSRHPSYAGFVWWAIGTQVMLANPFGLIAFSIVLYRFFAQRIRVEEVFLVKFFGDDYRKYQQEVPTRILFIR